MLTIINGIRSMTLSKNMKKAKIIKYTLIIKRYKYRTSQNISSFRKVIINSRSNSRLYLAGWYY